MNRRNFLTLLGLGAVAGVVGVKAVGETIPATSAEFDWDAWGKFVLKEAPSPPYDWLTCPIKYAGKG